MISENIRDILSKIEAAKKYPSVRVVAATKTVPVSSINEALSLGITEIGENRVQEAGKKFPLINFSSKLKKHFIGHLQSNKVKKAVSTFDLIQSVDSFRILETINFHAAQIKKVQECLIEIKISNEESKYGLLPQNIGSLLQEAALLKNIKIIGIMAMAPYFDKKELSRPYYASAYKYYSKFADEFSFTVLSMGMTGDFEIALAEGSNMVRIGTGIFGERRYNI
ncbi:MAG: hypothetical protein BWY26_00200 [Elusimicrobia bacterium ADurb.Bin231]|nr:MAG: hypothetical protein BWY26_00200 [Elusimicrobia bacterium ADurb.Bin231]